MDVVWACPNGVRIDALDEGLLRVMKKSGCYLLAFGIESGSQMILDRMAKRLSLGIIADKLELVKKAGIETWGFFIIGLPGETEISVQETIALAKKLPLDRAQFCRFAPLPGTSIFIEWTKDMDLSEIDWPNLNYSGKGVYNTEGLSSQRLASLQKQAFREFYLRPLILIKILTKLRFRQIKWLIKRFKAYIFAN
jgi:radical SAM superfamily enzyme YgiQ (UPF0313 family)